MSKMELSVSRLVSGRRASLVLSRPASLWVASGVVAQTLWTSAAPAMAYRIYAHEWGLSPTVTTAIFAIYPISVVAVLIGFGDLSDHIGRRAAMLMGLAASILGAVIFATAPNVGWLLVARAAMGVGVGLTAGPSTAAVIEFGAPGASRRAAMVTTVAQAVGFAAGLIVGGLLVQYAPWPMRAPFWLLAGLLALLFVATWFLPRGVKASARWRPRVPHAPRPIRGAFVLAASAMTSAYTHGAIVLSLGGQVAYDLVGSPNVFVNGATLSLFAIVSGAVGLAGRLLPARAAMSLGAVASISGMGLIVLAAEMHALAVFLLAVSTAGAGYSLPFLSALDVADRAAPANQRGGVLSALYLVAYLAMGSIALALGVVATAKGLQLAVDLGAGVIAVLSLFTLFLALSERGLTPRRP